MSKLRSISTSFWSDPFIEDLSPNEKLLFIYLITNERTNMLGIYEASTAKMAFETGIEKTIVEKALKGFERLNKVKYVNNYVVLVNYLKHQRFNTNMKKSAIDVYFSLPKELKDSSLNIDRSNPSEGFETLLNHYGMVRKVEVEVEVEVEEKGEVKDKENKEIPLFEDFKKYALSKEPQVDLKALNLKYDAWIENGWKDGHDNVIKNWKVKLINTIVHLPKKPKTKWISPI